MAFSFYFHSSARIPFTQNIRTTITSPYTHDAVLWFVIRGLESYPVTLGDIVLPPSARLQVVTLTNVSLTPQQLINLTTIPQAYSGALLRVQLDASSTDFNYLEACLRLYSDGSTTPLYLSSGTEDYFLSASYFDEGMFKTPQSGVCNLD